MTTEENAVQYINEVAEALHRFGIENDVAGTVEFFWMALYHGHYRSFRHGTGITYLFGLSSIALLARDVGKADWWKTRFPDRAMKVATTPYTTEDVSTSFLTFKNEVDTLVQSLAKHDVESYYTIADMKNYPNGSVPSDYGGFFHPEALDMFMLLTYGEWRKWYPEMLAAAGWEEEPHYPTVNIDGRKFIPAGSDNEKKFLSLSDVSPGSSPRRVIK